MEELSEIHGDSLSTVKELGKMKMLRNLKIMFNNFSLEMEESFVELVGKLSNIQSFEVSCRHVARESTDLLGDRWVPPPSL
jgi:hypothetical protein